MPISAARLIIWSSAVVLGLTLLGSHLMYAPSAGAATAFGSINVPEPGSPAAIASAKHGLDLSQLDPTCEPCKDFAQFADGGWLKANPIPARYPLWGRVFALRDTNTARLHSLIEADAAPDAHDNARERQVGDYYAACTDTDTIDKLGISPIASELARAAAVANGASLTGEIAHLHDIGIGAFFDIGSESNPAGSAKPEILALNQPSLSLPDKSYYLDPAKEKQRAAFVDHVTKMFTLAGDDAETSAGEAKAVLAFEITLAQNMRSPVELRDPIANTNVMPYAKAAALLGSFDFSSYLADRHIPQGSIDVGQPAYMPALAQTLASTAPADIATVLRWDIIDTEAPLLAKPFDDENFHFNGTVLSGTAEQRPRWQRCIDGTTGALGDSVGIIFDSKYFPAKQRARAMAMILSVKAELHDDLATLSWMSPRTRAFALQKLNLMAIKVGYPDHPRDYSSVAVKRDTYLANRMSATMYGVRRNLSFLGKPLDRKRWNGPSPTVNAGYNGSANDITFYAGILQAPFFSDTFDDATNYGAMGIVMGHEMTHAFDDQGRHVDGYGALKDWWTAPDAKNFEARASCVRDQFDQFVIGDGVHANGALELGEAIADLGGANLAYRAFERSQAGKPRKTIDGFTPEQRFFLGFATFQTEEDRLEYAKQRATSEPHPLGKFRIDGALANMPEFAKAFSCSINAPMVRTGVKRCQIW